MYTTCIYLFLIICISIQILLCTHLTGDIGNIIDFSTRIYLLSRGNKYIFIILKYLLLPLNKYPDNIYIPSDKCFNTKWNLYYKFNDYLWQTSDQNKKLIINYSRGVITNMIKYNMKIKPDFDTTNSICIHIRCSDIPFVKHPNYHLYTFKWYKKAIDLALTLGQYDNIYIISCSNHKANKKYVEYCDIFVNEYKKFISKKYPFLETTVKCQGLYQDMYSMFTSKCLIASSSSFSFYTGISASNIFITTSINSSEKCSNNYYNERCSGMIIRDNMYHIDADYIDHNSVECYINDKDEVLTMLNN